MNDEPGTPDPVRIERTLEAPVGLVWQMWTEPDHFKAWYGPTGARVPVANIELAVGGTRHVCMEMETPKGPMTMWFVGQHQEIVVNERLVYTESMSDENGNVLSPAAMGMPGHPETTEVIVELEDLGGSTRMVLTHVGIPADSGGAGGWAMALDKLATRVGELSR